MSEYDWLIGSLHVCMKEDQDMIEILDDCLFQAITSQHIDQQTLFKLAVEMGELIIALCEERH